MIIIKNLSKVYQTKYDKIHALRNINLELGNQGLVMITGKSGSGKSTLLNILGGLEVYDDGDIIINGKSTKNFTKNDWDAFRNQYVGYVYQEFYLIDDITIKENVSLALKLQNQPEKDIEVRVQDTLKLVSLEDYINHKPTEISGGQAQRVAIARALIKNPELILADEPTGNLDSETGRSILELLKELSKTRLVIMVTHDLEFAYQYGDRVIELKDGEIIHDTHDDDLKTNIYEGIDDYDKVIRLPKGKKLSSYLVNYLNRIITENEEKYILQLSATPPTNLTTVIPEVEKTVSSQEITETVNEELQLNKSYLPFKYALKMVYNSFFKKKGKLILMFMSIIFALLFIGIALNFGMYDVNKASALTFEKANIKIIPLDRETTKCENQVCWTYYSPMSYDKDMQQYFIQEFPDIKIIHSYYPILEIDELTNIENDSYYFMHIEHGISKITILEEDISALNYYGNLPENNQVLITDYILEALVEFAIFPKLSNYDDYIGRVITLEGTPLTISGIVFTGIEKFHPYKETEYYPGEFNYNMSYGLFTQVYMNQTTFDALMKTESSHLYINDKYIYGKITNYDNTYQSWVTGRLPEKVNEIAIALSALNDLSETYELDDEITIAIGGYEERTFTIVGIFDDSTELLPFTVMFSQEYYEKLINETHYKQMQAVLTDNPNENTNFFRMLAEHKYRHNTFYTTEIYSIEKILGQLQILFYIIGGLFFIFGSVLIFTFILFSISDKQKEIGILRALGARLSDVSKIFITEGVIIAFVASILANIFIVILMRIINNGFVKELKLNVVIIYNNILTNFIITLIAIIMVVISTYIPIRHIANMKPVKAIKG